MRKLLLIKPLQIIIWMNAAGSCYRSAGITCCPPGKLMLRKDKEEDDMRSTTWLMPGGTCFQFFNTPLFNASASK
ncbi:MAG: hypothetical protein JST86_04330 [Bacteroidetes bacterium]|nr:hypothetical protein [Bacteroidota bacterium]